MAKIPFDQVDVEIHDLNNDDANGLAIALIFPEHRLTENEEVEVIRHTYHLSFGDALSLSSRIRAIIS